MRTSHVVGGFAIVVVLAFAQYESLAKTIRGYTTPAEISRIDGSPSKLVVDMVQKFESNENQSISVIVLHDQKKAIFNRQKKLDLVGGTQRIAVVGDDHRILAMQDVSSNHGYFQANFLPKDGYGILSISRVIDGNFRHFETVRYLVMPDRIEPYETEELVNYRSGVVRVALYDHYDDQGTSAMSANNERLLDVGSF